MWGTYFGWMLPAIGLLLCVAMMVVMVFFCIGRGSGCMHGSRKP